MGENNTGGNRTVVLPEILPVLAKRVSTFESSFERCTYSFRAVSDYLVAIFLVCFVASCTYVIVSLLYIFMLFVQCGYLYYLGCHFFVYLFP